MLNSRFNFKSFVLIALCTTGLSACGTSNDVSYTQKSPAPVPPITEMDAALSQPAPKLLSSDVTITGEPQTPEQRIAQLEATVASLRADYDRIMPAFASLNTTNERIQVLLDELEGETKAAVNKVQDPQSNMAKAATLKVDPSMPPKAPVSQNAQAMRAVVDKPLAPAMSAPSPTASKVMDSSITAIRIGEHGEKTRLVFDLSSKAKPEFAYDLDNEEKLLMVEMPASSWAAKDSGKPSNSLMVSGWSVQPLPTGGSAIAIQLKKDARVLSTEFLKAEGKDPARMVMDIGSGS